MADNPQAQGPSGDKDNSGRDDIMKGATKSAHDVKKLRQYLKALKALQKGLKKESDQYKDLEKDAKRLERSISRLVKSKTQLAKVADSLTSKLGRSGVGGGITQFSTAAVNASTSVNQLDGSMNILGKSTSVSATSFKGWVSAVQLAIAVVVKLADELDKAQIKQANLQRAFGAGNISIRESFQAVTQGWKTAGAAGAEAAPKLNEAIRAARGNLMGELGGPTGGGFQRLLQYQIGIDPQTTERVRELVEIFNIRTGDNLMSQLDHLYDVIVKSGLPMERYGGLIFELGKQFADIGIDAMDAAGAVGAFEEATVKGHMTMGLAMKMGRLAMNQQLTAGGFQGRVLTAAFAQDMWSKVDKDTRGELDRAASQAYGKGTGFRDIDAYEASNLLANLETTSPGLYTRAMEGSFRKLMQIEKESGFGAAEQTAQAMGIPEWREFKRAWTGAEGAPPTYEKLQEITMTSDERMLEASKKMLAASDGQMSAMELAKMNAELNQQWYNEFSAFWTHTLGLIVGGLGGGEEIFGAVQEGAMGMLAGPTGYAATKLGLQQSDLWGEITGKFNEVGAWSPEMQAQRKKFTESTGGITSEMLGEYARPGGRMDQGLSMLVPPTVDLEIAKGKFVSIKFEVVEGLEGEEVGGTTLR